MVKYEFWPIKNFNHLPVINFYSNENGYKLTIQKLGKGAGSTVMKAIYNNKEYAVKFIIFSPSFIIHNQHLRELVILSRQSYKYLNSLIDFNIDLQRQTVSYVLPFAITLYDFSKNEYDLKILLEQFNHICNSVAFLHNKNIVHRDIKPQNILYKNNISYLTDFDSVRINFCQNHTNLSYPITTLYYRAPEIILDQKYDFSIDIWSLGIVYIELLTKHLPVYNMYEPLSVLKAMVGYLGPKQKDQWLIRNWFKISNISIDKFYQKYQGLTLDNDATLSAESKEFIRYILVFNPNNRPTVYNILNHQHLKNTTIIKELSCYYRSLSYDYYPIFNWKSLLLKIKNYDYTDQQIIDYRQKIFKQFDIFTNNYQIKILILYLLDRLVEQNYDFQNNYNIWYYTMGYLYYLANAIIGGDQLTWSQVFKNSNFNNNILDIFKSILYTLNGDLIFTSVYDLWLLDNINANYLNKLQAQEKAFNLQLTELPFIYKPSELYNQSFKTNN